MEATLRARRARTAEALKLDDALLLVGAGEPISIPGGADQVYPFLSHSEYFHLTDLNTPGGVVAYDPKDGVEAGWVSFVPEVTEAQRVWEGRESVPGTSVTELHAWLAARRDRPLVNLGSPLVGVGSEPALVAAVREQFTHARRPKDGAQLDRIRAAAAATAAGFKAAGEMMRSGVTERELQIEIEVSFTRAGGTRTGYDTIVGIGPHSAVLHFSPTERAAKDGDLILIDAGAEVRRYTADVTRTYVVGKPRGIAKDLYAIVIEAEERAIARCVVGAEWRDIHLRCAVEMTAGLVSLGLMRGDAESLVESEAHLLFFPHGIGHMVGLGVRDAGGTLPGRPKSQTPSLKNLRTDLPLQPGYVMTVEPGLYFIPALLNDPARRVRFKDAVAWDKVDPLIGTGGIRIEDNILITDGAPESLTAAIPETVFATFQLTFAIITPALIVGAFAERMKFSAMLMFMGLWFTVVYTAMAHAVWSGDGGFFWDMGVLDFAGGTVVHINAGIAGLVAAFVLGPRKGYPKVAMMPHNLGYTLMGASMLWFGWFGFNAGSAVAANGSAGMAMVVTQIATAGAALAWMFSEWISHGKPSVLGIASGAVTGLVAITPA